MNANSFKENGSFPWMTKKAIPMVKIMGIIASR